MAGNGKYTKYVSDDPNVAAKNVRLGKLFQGRGDVINPYAIYVENGDPDGARLALLEGNGGFENNLGIGAREMMQPSAPIQDAVVVNEFGASVDLNYNGDPNGITIPNTAEGQDVVWAEAGDPVNPFMPDLRSPGPHLTEATSESNMADAPDAEVGGVAEFFDSLGKSYVPGAPGTGTASPTSTKQPVQDINTLGGGQVPLGTSDSTKPFE